MVVLVSILNIRLSRNVQVRTVEIVLVEFSVEKVNFIASENQTLRTHDGDTWEVNLDAGNQDGECIRIPLGIARAITKVTKCRSSHIPVIKDISHLFEVKLILDEDSFRLQEERQCLHNV